MKLLQKNEYNRVEELLRAYSCCTSMEEPYKSAMEEIIKFFNIALYKDILEIFYLYRYNYINRHSTNSSLFTYLSNLLHLQEPTLYVMRKEIVYKAAMIFYKYHLLD